MQGDNEHFQKLTCQLFPISGYEILAGQLCNCRALRLIPEQRDIAFGTRRHWSGVVSPDWELVKGGDFDR